MSVPSFRHLPECFGCGAENVHGLGLAIEAGDDRARCRTRFLPDHQGAPGLVHGGLLATLLDEVMGSMPLDGAIRLTSTMELRFLRPVAVGRDVEAVARLAARDGRRVSIDGGIRYPGDLETRVEASATYVLVDRSTVDAAGSGAGG
jgi:uncharacterized protein (TIGR00369 family)